MEKTGLYGCEDPVLSAVRPPVDITFLEMILVLKRLPTPAINTPSQSCQFKINFLVQHVSSSQIDFEDLINLSNQ